MNIKMHERFELWATQVGLSVQKSHQDDYSNQDTQQAWAIWQSASLAERESCAAICDERAQPSGMLYDYDKGFQAAAKTCARMIRAS
ncbi:MAG: hypothetical protein Q7T32_03845 [Moraxellaceae bacterium]|nr:hypothetical protein [Moraxellaceae bacterium]